MGAVKNAFHDEILEAAYRREEAGVLDEPRPITAFEIGEQSAHKPLRPFGSALIRSPVREGIAMADRMNLEKEHDR